jgi:PAS domain S-box-containing protein
LSQGNLIIWLKRFRCFAPTTHSESVRVPSFPFALSNAFACSLITRLNHFLRSSVRGRLAFLVIAITAPAMMLVALLIFQAYRNEREAVGSHLLATARATSLLVDSEIEQSEGLLNGLATSHQLAIGEFASFQRRAELTIGEKGGRIVLTDASGRVLAATGSSDTLPQGAINPEFHAAMDAGRTFVSNLLLGEDASRHFVCVTVPILKAGRLEYTLSHVIPPSSFAGVLESGRFTRGIVVSLLDRTGTIVVRHPNGERFAGRKAMPDIVAAVTARTEGSHTSVTLEGDSVLAVYSRAPKFGWSVAMGVPFAVIHASAERMILPGLATAALLMAVAIFMATWIGRGLVRGVDTLVAQTEAIGSGAVPSERSTGLAETNFVAEAMRKSALRLSQRDDENAALAAKLKMELEQRRRSEEASRRLASIVESSEDAILSKNLDGIITSWNRAAERLFGYSAAEIVGQPITILIPPDRAHEPPQILDRIRCGERIEHFETFRVRKNGELVPISLTVSPLYDQDGNIIGASKISRDVSQRHRADLHQQALYELVARVNRAEALPEIFDAALDAMGRCIEANRAAILLADASGAMKFVASRRLSDEYRGKVEGHSPWNVADQNPQPIWIDDIANADLAAPLKTAIEAEGIRALAFVPLTYEKRLLGKFMIYFDAPHVFSAAELRPVETISRQVAFAIERQRGADALESLVTERTASLRQVMAQMEEFSYTISHDLRAPVRAMRGYAEVVIEDHGWRLEAEARELLARIVRSASRMDRLILDLLTYSRISRRELKLEPVSLDKLVRDVLQQYPDMSPERADIKVESPLPDVVAHEASLTQVISNLLSNAVKFVPPNGRPQVRVTFDRRDAQARLWFEDNGIGIKPEHQSRLFGMFERVHPDRHYEGTGVGLAIVRKAIERMNGAVGVESDGVSGSRFWIELPMASATDGENAPEPPK